MSDTQETWPPPPSKPELDESQLRTQGVEVSVSGDVLTFRMLFIRSFIVRFGWFMAALVPLLIVAPYVGYLQSSGVAGATQLGPALGQRLLQVLPAIAIIAGNIAFLWLIFETMLLRGTFRFDRSVDRFWAGLMPHSSRGLRYIAVRRQVSKTKTWTRWCFYLGFDHDVAAAFDRYNPLHRVVALYGEARANEYYLGYITDQDASARTAQIIARFASVDVQLGD